MSIRIAVVSLSSGVFINQISYSCRLFGVVTTNGIRIVHAEPGGIERGKDGWSRPLDGCLDNRMIWIKAIGLIGMNLTDQNECVPHQDARQTNQTENGIKSKRLP